MSDGIELLSPCCHYHYAKQKEGNVLKVKLKEHSLKHPEDEVWYDSSIPVYTCGKCKKQWAMERVNK
ncbi:hypothetical protein LCGC14_1943270 [marine sediment metagenome]|uniref:Uncharacterized protein n=1 Tax=marine sediment metagenome TaxID=412755 RepID=A0A0F9HXZ5_9ZZZZ